MRRKRGLPKEASGDRSLGIGQSLGAIGAHAGEIELRHRVAIRRMPGGAVCAFPTGAEGDGHAITRSDLTDVAPALLDDAGALMAEHGRQRQWERPGHPHEVRVAKTDTHDTNSHLIGARRLETQLLESELTHRYTDNRRLDQHQPLSFNLVKAARR
jgi:hypothetical protein